MAINRAPFNALVDDDGSGTKGSVWNKAAIASVILDPADAAYAQGPGSLYAPASAPWQTVAFNAANFWNPAITAGMVAANKYVVLQGKTVLWMVQLAGAPAPATATPYLNLATPYGSMPGPGAGVFSPAAYCLENGANTPALIFEGNPNLVQVLKSVGGNWAGTISLYFTAILALA